MMALKNGKDAANKKTTTTATTANDKSGLFDSVGHSQMGNHESKGTIKFSAWSQTNYDVTITLHTGRNLSSNDVSVDFRDQAVLVGLTDGRRWSCRFYEPVDKESARVQLKKMKLFLTVKKKTPNVVWPTYEQADTESSASSLSESDTSGALKSCFDLKSLMKSKSAAADGEFLKPLKASKAPGKRVERVSQSETEEFSSRLLTTSLAIGPDARGGSGDEVLQKIGSELDKELDKELKYVTSKMADAREPSVSQDAREEDMVCDFGESNPVPTVDPMSEQVGSSSDSQSSPTLFPDSETMAEVVKTMDYEDTGSPVSTTPLSPTASSGQVYAGPIDESYVSREAFEQIKDKNPVSVEPRTEVRRFSSIPESDACTASGMHSDSEAAGSAADDMDTDVKPGDDVRDLALVKSDIYEKADFVVLIIYVKQIKQETLKVNFGETDVEVIFQTSDQKFLQSYEGSTAETFFRWKVHLVSTIIPESCSCRLSGVNLSISLYKKFSRKWGTLTALPQMGSSPIITTQNTWMPTGQSSANAPASSSVGQRQPATVVFDELNNPPAKSSKQSTSGSGHVGDDTGRRDVSGTNKPTCKVSPLTSTYADSTVLPSAKRPVVVINPGMMGLDNIGNTCFMNSVLQVLANTIELKNYFLDGFYQRELNCDNPLGMGGKLAMAFGYLMKVLWTSNQPSFEPSKLKNLVAAKQTRFVGYSQHDAEEFMEFLLDGLHEDLNRVKDKPYFEDRDITEDADEAIANEAWKRHKMRNDSHVIDIFQGQYRSRVVCPECETVSITFDPFSIIQVPIPKEKKLINVVFMSTVPSNRPVKFPIQIGVDANVDQLKDALYQRTRVKPENMRVLKVTQCQIACEFTTGMGLQEVTYRDLLIACAILSKNDIGEPVREFTVVQRTTLPRTVPRCCNYCHRENSSNIQLKRCTKCYKASYCDQDCQRKDWNKHKQLCILQGEPIGCPFIISVPESKMTFGYLCSTIEAFARYSVNAFQPPPLARKIQGSRKNSTTSSMSVSSLSSVASSEMSEDPDAADRSSGETSESQSETSDAAIPGEDTGDEAVKERTDDNSSAAHLTSETESNVSQPPVRCVLATQQNATPSPPPPFFIRPCTRNGTALNGWPRLQDTATEKLELEGCRSLLVEWKNKENCVPFVEVATKDLDYEECESKFQTGSNLNINCGNDITLNDCLTLFTEPEVLHPDQTWFCPKCKTHQQATKEMSLWRLPPTLIIHLKRFSFSSMFWRNKIDDKVTFPLSGLDMTPYLKRPLSPDDSPPIYDLYGVINHKGDLVGGHYTAFARCPNPDDFTKNQVEWRCFDDSNVTKCDSQAVNTQFAYVLFYRRRDTVLTLSECSRMDTSPPGIVNDRPMISDHIPTVANDNVAPKDETSLALDDSVVMNDVALVLDILEKARMENKNKDRKFGDGDWGSLRITEAMTEAVDEEKDMNCVD